MLLALRARSDTDIKILAAGDQLVHRRMPDNSGLASFRVSVLPWPERVFERSSKLFHWPCVDDWLDEDVDWLYSPAEAMLATRRYPVALTIHDLHALEDNLPWSSSARHRWFAARWRRWIGRAAKEARVILTVSEFTKARVQDFLGIDGRRVRVIGNGYRDFRTVPECQGKNLQSLSQRPFTLVVGGLSPRKGGDLVLAVAQRLMEKQSDLLVVVVGSVSSFDMSKTIGLRNVQLVGAVPDAELAFLYRRASSLLFLSRYEGFGIPAVEAMGSGIPAVVSDRAALPETVGDGAILVEPGSTNEIVAHLENLAYDCASRDYWIERGLRRAQEFSWERCAQRMREALEELH